jgi:hypothetical protein
MRNNRGMNGANIAEAVVFFLRFGGLVDGQYGFMPVLSPFYFYSLSRSVK